MDEIRLNQWTLEQKEAESRKIIKEAIEKYGKDKIGVAWSGGKDSTTVCFTLLSKNLGKSL